MTLKLDLRSHASRDIALEQDGPRRTSTVRLSPESLLSQIKGHSFFHTGRFPAFLPVRLACDGSYRHAARLGSNSYAPSRETKTYLGAIEPVRSSGFDGIQSRQMISFFASLTSAARSIASRTDHHSSEYGLSAANSDSLGDASPDAIVPLFFRAFADFTLLRTGTGPSLSQPVSVLVLG
jgi:hypothetical protein